MVSELSRVSEELIRAKRPEEIFGELEGLDPEARYIEVTSIFKRLSKCIHPDRNPDQKDEAEKAFKRLNHLRQEAEERIKQGIYGTKIQPILVKSRKGEYLVGEEIFEGEVCKLYSCSLTVDRKEEEGLFKIARSPTDNDLVSNEARILKKLQEDKKLKQWQSYVPDLLDTFGYRQDLSSPTQQVNILHYPKGLYSLEEVFKEHQFDLDPRDMAWMWGRLLIALGFAHQQGVIHGAVTPTHILIHPEQHGLVLIDWAYAVTNGERIRAIVEKYEGFYPEEVFKKEVPTPGLDIYMAAKCMVYLLGGDPATSVMPDSVPKQLRAFFNGCQLKGANMRPQDAWNLRAEFIELIERLWGKRVFRPFHMIERR